jgi:nucleotide-binding universal stress UspA family protein
VVTKLLIATDLSASSDPALRFGFELARQLHARVGLLYAYAFPGPPGPGAFYAKASQAVYDQARGDLLRRARAFSDLEVQIMVRSGHPLSSILEAAQELAADLVVLGSHHLRGVEHLLAGSVAERVAQRACCPVLVVPGLDPAEV